VRAVVDDLLQIQKNAPKAPFEYDNFEEFLKGNFGETLYGLYFQPYNLKIWNTDLSQVALEWLEGKLPMPNIREIFLSNIIKEEESGMVHATFFYPKAGGSQFIADRLSEGLDIKKGVEVRRIARHKEGLRMNNALTADAVVYTGDVRKLAGVIDTTDAALQEAMAQVQDLKSNGTSNLFCECDDNDLSWLYIPEDFTRAHRIIYTGNFSPLNNRGSRRKTCVVEFSGQVAPAVMEAEVKKLPGNLSPLSFNYEPNSYVVQEKDTRRKIGRLKELLKKDNFYLLGRFAEWEYYNMDKAIEASQKVYGEIIAGQ
jgi:protoporphyrinogen oxidase